MFENLSFPKEEKLVQQHLHRWAPHTLHLECSVKACSWPCAGSSPCPWPAWEEESSLDTIPSLLQLKFDCKWNKLSQEGKRFCFRDWSQAGTEGGYRVKEDTKSFLGIEQCGDPQRGHCSLSLLSSESCYHFQLCGNRVQHCTEEFLLTSVMERWEKIRE